MLILTQSVAFVARFLLLLEAEAVNDNDNGILPDDNADAFSETILWSKSRPELQKLCRYFGLLVGGTKQTLINQLMDPQDSDYRKRSLHGGRKKGEKQKAQTKEDQYKPYLGHF